VAHAGQLVSSLAQGVEGASELPSLPVLVLADVHHEAIAALGASSSDCAIITATAATIRDATDAGLATIGYTAMPGADQKLTAAGACCLLPAACCLLPSLADLTLRLRARPLPN
jgi:hypothetical protein